MGLSSDDGDTTKNESPILPMFLGFTKYYAIFVLILFHVLKAEKKKKPFGPITNLFSFSTRKH